MKRFLLLLLFAACSPEETPKEIIIEYEIELRNTCITDVGTIYREYLVEKEVYDRLTKISLLNCPTVSFKDIEGEDRTGIFSGYGTNQ